MFLQEKPAVCWGGDGPGVSRQGANRRRCLGVALLCLCAQVHDQQRERRVGARDEYQCVGRVLAPAPMRRPLFFGT